MKNEIEHKAYAKPLSFSTTMRNPGRIAGFINCLLPYENKILTDEVIMAIVHNVIKSKLYRPNYVGKDLVIKGKFDSDDKDLSDDEVAKIIVNSPQEHKEKGFKYGWPSRFDTWFKLPMEFGFIFYEMNKPLKISNIGHMLIDAFNEKPTNEQKIQNIFLNSMIKFQPNNPFRKNSNENIPLSLLLNVIKMLKEDPTTSDAGVFIKELSVFICWPNNDAEELYKYLKDLRTKVGFNYSDEYMYDQCLELLGADSTQKNRFKMEQICGEAVDEYIRKMRTTGVISLRGNGRFLDFNSFESEKIEYVINNYSKCKNFDSKEDYFKYVGEIDNNILELTRKEMATNPVLRKNKLIDFASKYDKNHILKELEILANRKNESSDPVFRFIPAPTRLEFLTSISLVQNFENLDVNPNYTIDDEGLPTFTAGGDMADIVCKSLGSDSLIEVTLMCGRQDQCNNEIVPIRRHLLDYKQNKNDVFSVFVAPVVHNDTKEMAKWYKHKDNIDIITLNINEFISAVSNKDIDQINKLLQYS